MIIIAFATFLLNLFYTGWIFMAIGYSGAGDFNITPILVLFLVFLCLTIFSFVGFVYIWRHPNSSVAINKIYRRYKIFLIINGTIDILTIGYILLGVSNLLPTKPDHNSYGWLSAHCKEVPAEANLCSAPAGTFNPNNKYFECDDGYHMCGG